ncbi:unnamed protein product [Urochloa humidicola]
MSMTTMKPVAALLAGVLALLEPAAAGLMKYSSHDLKSEKTLRRLYLRWSRFYGKPAEMHRRFPIFNDTAHRVASRVREGEPQRFRGRQHRRIPRLHLSSRLTPSGHRKGAAARGAVRCQPPGIGGTKAATAGPAWAKSRARGDAARAGRSQRRPHRDRRRCDGGTVAARIIVLRQQKPRLRWRASL